MKKLAQGTFRGQLLVLGVIVCRLCLLPLACNVPAFRYALERWPADAYQVVIYYRTPPREELGMLRKGAAERGGLTNYSLQTVDVTKPEGKALAQQRDINAYPWVQVFYPVHSEFHDAVWSGPLTSDAVTRIVQSRARSAIVERLLSGDVAVWAFLRSGHEGKDRRALDALKASLEQASATLRMPEIGTDQNGDPIVVTDFKTYPVHFAVTEIARNDPNEHLLVNALLRSEPDLVQFDEPMAFPVFGRGRALYALVGSGIQEKTILEACQSLIGWCSCEIKVSNPGTDLLISADWTRPYGGKMVKDPEVPLVGLGGFVPTPGAEIAQKSEPKPASSAPACVLPTAAKPARPPVAQSPEALPSRLRRNVFYLAGGAGIVLVALSLLVTLRKRRQER